MAVKALIAAALLVAIVLGVAMPVPHGDNTAEAKSTIPSMELTRG